MDNFIIIPLIYAAFNALCGVAYYRGWADSNMPAMTEPFDDTRKKVMHFAFATSGIAVLAAIGAAFS